MKIGIDCQFLNIGLDRNLQNKLRQFFEDLKEIDSIEVQYFSLPRQNHQSSTKWKLRKDSKQLISSGPMCIMAWESGCNDLDWLIVPAASNKQVLIPGSAPCRLSTILYSNNISEKRAQVLKNYQLIFTTDDLSVISDQELFFESEILKFDFNSKDFLNALDFEKDRNPTIIQSKREKPGLAFFSPARPIRSGISDYSEKLIQYLKDEFEITLFLDGYEPKNETIKENFEFRHQADYSKWKEKNPDALDIFVLGNNFAHKNIFMRSQVQPGIVELHEILPLAFGIHQDNHWCNRLEWDDFVQDGYGKSLDEMEQSRFENGLNYDLQPILKTMLNKAEGAIVHNEYTRQRIADRLPDMPVVNTGLGADLRKQKEYSEEEIDSYRRSIGVEKNDVLFVVLGEINFFKRYNQIAHAYSIVREVDSRIKMVFAGGSDDPKSRLHITEALENYDLADQVKVLGYLEADNFTKIMQGCDAAINLRYPTFGEASAAITTLMGTAKPVIVSAECQFLEYPDEACWKIPTDYIEPYLLAEAMLELSSSKDLRMQIGKNAFEYISQFTWEKCAKVYSEFLMKFFDRK